MDFSNTSVLRRIDRSSHYPQTLHPNNLMIPLPAESSQQKEIHLPVNKDPALLFQSEVRHHTTRRVTVNGLFPVSPLKLLLVRKPVETDWFGQVAIPQFGRRAMVSTTNDPGGDVNT